MRMFNIKKMKRFPVSVVRHKDNFPQMFRLLQLSTSVSVESSVCRAVQNFVETVYLLALYTFCFCDQSDSHGQEDILLLELCKQIV